MEDIDNDVNKKELEAVIWVLHALIDANMDWKIQNFSADILQN